MALHGDFKTIELSDLLQWIDGARKSGLLTLGFAGGERRFFLSEGTVERVGFTGIYEHTLRLAQLAGLVTPQAARAVAEQALGGQQFERVVQATGVDLGGLVVLVRDEMHQAVADRIGDQSGSFHFTEERDADHEESVVVGTAIREVVYEAHRIVDEAREAAKAVGGDAVVLRALRPVDASLVGLRRCVAAAVGPAASLGGVRLRVGLSRGGAIRLVHDLWRGGWLAIEGAETPRPDPLSQMLRQGEKLLAQGEYEAAALVFGSLLAADPSDRRVKDFARAVEREHVETLYRQLLPVAVPRLLVPPSSLAALRPDERIVATLLNGRWDVSTLVLASPLRELQTLKALDRMVKLGLMETSLRT